MDQFENEQRTYGEANAAFSFCIDQIDRPTADYRFDSHQAGFFVPYESLFVVFIKVDQTGGFGIGCIIASISGTAFLGGPETDPDHRTAICLQVRVRSHQHPASYPLVADRILVDLPFRVWVLYRMPDWMLFKMQYMSFNRLGA
jgi:hypothetical protein